MAEDGQGTDNLGTWSGGKPLEIGAPGVPAKKGMSRRDFLRSGVQGVVAGVVAAQPGAKVLANLAEGVQAWQGGQEAEKDLDIIPREELLNRYRTGIFDLPEGQFPDNYVELEFRRSAGEEVLFQRLEKGRIIGLDVILVNSDSVDPAKLTPEQREFISKHSVILNGLENKIREVEGLNRKEIAENRDSMRAEYQQKLAELDAQRREQSWTDDRYTVENEALRYAYERYLMDEPSEQDLKEIGIRGYTSMEGTGKSDRGETGPRSFIFLAVRDKEKEITFTSGQETKTVSSSRIPYGTETGAVFAPNPEQSHPNENSFQMSDDPNSNGYVVVGGHTPGFIFRHEASHARGVFSEEDADKMALEGIVNAADHMKETGSDEKYWVVFRTPEGITITSSPEPVSSV